MFCKYVFDQSLIFNDVREIEFEQNMTNDKILFQVK